MQPFVLCCGHLHLHRRRKVFLLFYVLPGAFKESRFRYYMYVFGKKLKCYVAYLLRMNRNKNVKFQMFLDVCLVFVISLDDFERRKRFFDIRVRF